MNFSRMMHAAVGLQHGNVTSQNTGSGLKVKLGCWLCASPKQLHGSHETPLPAACLSEPGREKSRWLLNSSQHRKNLHHPAGRRTLLLEYQAKREISNFPFTVEKKERNEEKKKKACNMGINVNLKWEQALNLLTGRRMLWLVHICPYKVAWCWRDLEWAA